MERWIHQIFGGLIRANGGYVYSYVFELDSGEGKRSSPASTSRHPPGVQEPPGPLLSDARKFCARNQVKDKAAEKI